VNFEFTITVIVLTAALIIVMIPNAIQTNATASGASFTPSIGANRRTELLSINVCGVDKTDRNGTTAASEMISKREFVNIEITVSTN
jgi:hypothetical protein